jgi:NAD(P)-dependent dehydrogenase (short-subunit alcohol dehydrogenase family)
MFSSAERTRHIFVLSGRSEGNGETRLWQDHQHCLHSRPWRIPPDVMEAIPYNTSKGAVITFTKDLAMKLARDGIQVNAIATGFFLTKIARSVLENSTYNMAENIPAGRYGNDTDLKGAAVFLASSASNYLIGHILNVDGCISATA